MRQQCEVATAAWPIPLAKKPRLREAFANLTWEVGGEPVSPFPYLEIPQWVPRPGSLSLVLLTVATLKFLARAATFCFVSKVNPQFPGRLWGVLLTSIFLGNEGWQEGIWI